MSKQELGGHTLSEVLEIALAKVKGHPVSDDVPLDELLQRVKFRLEEYRLRTERERLFSRKARSYMLMHPGGNTKYSQQLEELLNIDRLASGLSPLIFNRCSLFENPLMSNEDQ